MAKGIIVLDEIPKSCVDCPMYYHAEDMSLGKFKYERLYKCKIMPEEVEQVYLRIYYIKSLFGARYVRFQIN